MENETLADRLGRRGGRERQRRPRARDLGQDELSGNGADSTWVRQKRIPEKGRGRNVEDNHRPS